MLTFTIINVMKRLVIIMSGMQVCAARVYSSNMPVTVWYLHTYHCRASRYLAVLL